MNEDTQARERWLEFVKALDAAVVLAFLTDDKENASPTYFKSLVPRINEAFIDSQATFTDSDGGWQPDPDVYLLELATDLEEDSPPEDFAYNARALAAIAVHSALEAYVEAVVGRRFGPLPERLRDELLSSSNNAGTQALYGALVEFNATRHILVHNRGVVDQRYLARVPSSASRAGDKRALPLEQILRYAHIALSCGSRLRQLIEPSGARS